VRSTSRTDSPRRIAAEPEPLTLETPPPVLLVTRRWFVQVQPVVATTIVFVGSTDGATPLCGMPIEPEPFTFATPPPVVLGGGDTRSRLNELMKKNDSDRDCRLEEYPSALNVHFGTHPFRFWVPVWILNCPRFSLRLQPGRTFRLCAYHWPTARVLPHEREPLGARIPPEVVDTEAACSSTG
jgi:hypothetical protein